MPHRVRPSARLSIASALIGLLILGTGLLVNSNSDSHSRTHDSKERDYPLVQNGSAPQHSRTRFEERLSLSDDEFTFRVRSSQDSRPIAGAIVTLLANGRAILAATNESGRASMKVNEAPATSRTFTVRADGYHPQNGTLHSSEATAAVSMEPAASILLSVDPGLEGAVPDSLPDFVVRVTAPPPFNDPMVFEGASPLLMQGLHLDREYTVHIENRGYQGRALERVRAGWPEPSRLTLPVKPLVGLGVIIRGITEADCPLLRVALRDRHGLGGHVSSVTWDESIEAGIAVPQHTSDPREVGQAVAFGPLSLELGSVEWQSGLSSSPEIELSLQTTQISLIVPPAPEAELPATAKWIGQPGDGFVPVSNSALTILSSPVTRVRTIDFHWGPFESRQVTLPRTDPIGFKVKRTGILRVEGLVAGQVPELQPLLEQGGRLQFRDVDPGAAEAAASAGTYTLYVDDEARLEKCAVFAGETTLVDLTLLARRSSLRVDLNGALDDGARVTLSRPHLGKLKSIAFAPFGQDGIARLSDLSPGHVTVGVDSPLHGRWETTAVLLPGRHHTAVVDDWTPERELSIQLVRHDGHPVPRQELRCWFHPKGRGPTQKLVTDKTGVATLSTALGGELVVATETSSWVRSVSPATEWVELRLPSPQPERRVVFSGWWASRVRNAIVVFDSGGQQSILATRIRPDEYQLNCPPGTHFLCVVTLENELVLLNLDATAEVIHYSEEPPNRAVSVKSADGSRPTDYWLTVSRAGDIEIRDSIIVRALGGVRDFRSPTLFKGDVDLVISAHASSVAGGVEWQSFENHLYAHEDYTEISLRPVPSMTSDENP